MRLKPCKCGEKFIKPTAKMCVNCQRKNRVSDVERLEAAKVQPWLSRAWKK